MNFKHPERHLHEFFELVPKLRLILSDIECWALENGETMTITCLIRTEAEQLALFEAGQAESKTSVHQFGRGADVRLFKNEYLNEKVGIYINSKFPYDRSRPHMKTLITHSGTASHHHVQCTLEKEPSI